MGFGFYDGLDSNVIDWANQMTIKPSGKYLYDLSIMVKKLKQSSIWSKLDRFWVFATEQQQHAQRDIRNLSTLTEINSITWTSLRGYTGNGSSTYLRSNYNPSVNGINYTQNSASMGLYCRTNLASNGITEIGWRDASNFGSQINARNASDFLGESFNSTAAGNRISNSDSRGLITLDRSSAVNHQGYRNGLLLGSAVVSSQTLSNIECYFLATNLTGSAINLSTRQVSMVFIGGSLGSDLQSKLYIIIQEFATKQGFNV